MAQKVHHDCTQLQGWDQGESCTLDHGPEGAKFKETPLGADPA